jgi:hypothetical protein
MKKIKLLTAGMFAMLALNVASAQTVEIRYTGSTAFRKGVCDAIENILQTGYVCGASGSTLNKANQQVFVGLAKGSGTQVIIKCSWSGSAGGVQSLAENIPAGQPFIDDPVASFSPSVSATVDGVSLTAGPNGANIVAADINDSHTADVALSDAFKESTPYTGAGFTALTSKAVGIVPFVWVGGAYSLDGGTTNNPGLYPGVSNLSIPQAQQLLAGGIALNQITGNSADNSNTAICIGRDHDSGTRIAAEYDAQYKQDIIFAQPTGYSEPMIQFIPSDATVGSTQFSPQTTGSGLLPACNAWPAETVLGENRPAGNEGFFSGSSVAAVLNRPADMLNIGQYDISYLGMSDSFGVNGGASYPYTDGAHVVTNITPSQNALLFEGVYPGTATHPFGPPYTNIEQGVYPFWGVEHYLYATALPSAQLTIATQVLNQLKTEADFAGVGDLLSNMTVTRAKDGQQIIPGNSFPE